MTKVVTHLQMRSVSSFTSGLCVFEKCQNKTFPFVDNAWEKSEALVRQSGPQGNLLVCP